MPSVLVTPETVREAQWQQDVPERPAVAPSQTVQPSRVGLMARVAALWRGTNKRPVQPYHWSENAPRPTEAPMERLAREHPQLFLIAHCG